MSAIAGIYHLNKEPVSDDHIRGIMTSFQKFPADDIRVLQKDNLFLGCHAQWVTPESVGEKLPYYDYQKKLGITADAIIDNREDLFSKLQIDITDRKRISDSELILLSYYKWGEDCPIHLIGDFAFMIWDERNQSIFGARDFSGSRTLYYFHDHERFAFSTTIDPLLTLPYVRRGMNEKWLAEFLAISGVIDTADSSITPQLNVAQIPPSHSIKIKRNEIKIKKYCSLTVKNRLRLKNTDEYIEAFQEVFEKAVSSRVRTFKGVGAHLSGGLDSGSVVSFAVNNLKKEEKLLHTYSYIPPKDFKDYTPKQLIPNESRNIQSTIDYVGGIKKNYLDFDGRNSYSDIDEFLNILEMPYKYFENSFWQKGIYEIANKEDVGILLNGGRGNMSISWGPAYEYYALLLKRLKWIKLFQELNQYSKNVGGARFRRLKKISQIAFPCT